MLLRVVENSNKATESENRHISSGLPCSTISWENKNTSPMLRLSETKPNKPKNLSSHSISSDSSPGIENILRTRYDYQAIWIREDQLNFLKTLVEREEVTLRLPFTQIRFIERRRSRIWTSEIGHWLEEVEIETYSKFVSTVRSNMRETLLGIQCYALR